MTRYGQMTEEEADYERKVRRERRAEAEEAEASRDTTGSVPARAPSKPASEAEGQS